MTGLGRAHNEDAGDATGLHAFYASLVPSVLLIIVTVRVDARLPWRPCTPKCSFPEGGLRIPAYVYKQRLDRALHHSAGTLLTRVLRAPSLDGSRSPADSSEAPSCPFHTAHTASRMSSPSILTSYLAAAGSVGKAEQTPVATSNITPCQGQ